MSQARKRNVVKKEGIDGEKTLKTTVDETTTVVDSTEDSITQSEKHSVNGEVRTSSTTKMKKEKPAKKIKKRLYESRRVIFLLGALIGIGFALYFGSKQNASLDLDKLVNFDTVSGYFEDWKDVLPSSIQSILNEADSGELHGSADSFSVGKTAKENGLSAKYNIIMVPGVISTGIESWGLEGTPECPSEPHFRKRLWGSFYMLRTMILDKSCWLKHIMLDPETGLDPPNIVLRAAQGFEAADFFMAGYWIWNKILQNLAVIGYGPNNMISAAYDWRLAYLDLERRDGYFSKLKSQIEIQKALNGEKAVLVGHSMGSQVIYYFMKWVEAEGEHFGNGGPTWINDHVSSFVDISGSVLGTPKAITALLSGEMKDTVQLNALAVHGLERFFSRKERVDMLKSFGGLPSMLPKGGDIVWGGIDSAPDDEDLNNKNDTYGKFIRFKEAIGSFSQKDLTMADSIEFLLEHSPKWFSDRVRTQYSYGIAKTEAELKANNQDFSKWANPLEAALPYAPDLKIYCFYGVGNPTERAYTYQEEVNKGINHLNVSIASDSASPVYFGDGDGTVSLLTHSMCHEWKKPTSRFNPSGAEVTIVEIKHEPDRFDIRGGAKTAEHVDILGSAELNELVLKVAAGQGNNITENYVSNLRELVDKMDF